MTTFSLAASVAGRDDARLAELRQQAAQIAARLAEAHRLPFVLHRIEQRLREIRRLRAENEAGFWHNYEEHKEISRAGLDAAGFIPGVGDIGDVLNGFLYLLDGEYADAAISLLGAVPFFGELIKGGRQARRVRKGLELLDEAADVRKALRRTKTGEQLAENAVVRHARKADNIADAVPKKVPRNRAVFNGNFRLDLPIGSTARKATLKRISKLKSDFLNSGGKIIWKTGKDPVDAAGKRIFGKFNSKKNTITLYKDADLSTLTHELLHFEQAKIGNRIGKNLIDTPAQRAIIERDIIWKLRQLGFVPRTP